MFGPAAGVSHASEAYRGLVLHLLNYAFTITALAVRVRRVRDVCLDIHDNCRARTSASVIKSETQAADADPYGENACERRAVV